MEQYDLVMLRQAISTSITLLPRFVVDDALNDGRLRLAVHPVKFDG